MRHAVFWLALIVVNSLSCSTPEFQDGVIQCGEGTCPDGMTCASDGYCYRNPGALLDAEVVAIDAAVDAMPGDLQPGAVLFFDATVCPAGWAPFTLARGRTVLALPENGTPLALVGEPLASGGLREISELPAHTHSVSPSPVTPPLSAHTHEIETRNNGGGTPSGVGFKEVKNGANDSTISSDTEGNHAHTLDIAPFDSAAPVGSIAAVDVTMPYIQLLACQKI